MQTQKDLVKVFYSLLYQLFLKVSNIDKIRIELSIIYLLIHLKPW